MVMSTPLEHLGVSRKAPGHLRRSGTRARGALYLPDINNIKFMIFLKYHEVNLFFLLLSESNWCGQVAINATIKNGQFLLFTKSNTFVNKVVIVPAFISIYTEIIPQTIIATLLWF